MVKQVKCPGCKRKYQPGWSYSQHVNSCKKLDSAADKALKNRKIAVAKKAEEKKAEIARRKELKSEVQESGNEFAAMDQTDDISDDQDMDVDIEINPVSS